MNFETIDWIIIAVLIVLALIVFYDLDSNIEVREHLSASALQQIDIMIQERNTKINQINQMINQKRDEERNWASNPLQFGPIRDNLNRVRDEIRRLEDDKARASQMINQYEAIKASGIQTNQEVQNLSNRVNQCDSLTGSLQEENNSLKNANNSLRNQLSVAQNAAQNLTNQNADDLVEAAITKLTEEIMNRSQGMNWDQVATRVGAAVEEQIKEFGQQYQTMNKDVLAQKLGEQAGKMVDDILDSMEADINDLNTPTPIPIDTVSAPISPQTGGTIVYNAATDTSKP